MLVIKVQTKSMMEGFFSKSDQFWRFLTVFIKLPH